MGLRGPAPTPSKILKARGSRRADARAAEEVSLGTGAPKVPPNLPAEAAAEWARQVKALEAAGVVAPVDRAALALWCCTWSDWVEARELIRTTLANGGSIVNLIAAGVYGVEQKAADRLLRIAAQFGFTPAARVRLRPAAEPEEASDGKSRFFAG